MGPRWLTCLFPSKPLPTSSRLYITSYALTDIDDPTKIVNVPASDGRSGEQRDIAYTNCKVIGNGSFGVVFQARLLKGYTDPSVTDELVAVSSLQV